MDYLYFMTSSDARATRLKIGVSNDPKRRMKELQTGNAGYLQIVGTIEAKSRMHALELESMWHKLLVTMHREGEWFLYNKQVRELVAAALIGPMVFAMAKRDWRAYERQQYRKYRSYRRKQTDIIHRIDRELDLHQIEQTRQYT